ncbi:MAG TPA: energy-coupling factor transporter transmembrane component T [Nocardioidaceae bacterium]|nr:energy-coupling factor transporter transmembrane component T [Nocardioidaceae bacterium]
MMARCGPLSLLLVCLLPAFGAPAIESVEHGLWSLLPVAVLAAVAVRAVGITLRRMALGLVAAGSIAVSTWLYGGHDLDTAVGASLRIIYLIAPGAIASTYLEPSSLADHLAQRLRLPPRVVVAASAALQRLDEVGEQWRQIGRARRARGVGAEGGPVRRVRVGATMAVALLVSTMRLSGRMSVAMDARGFARAQRRTWAEPAPWRPADSVAALAGVALAVVPWLLR